MIRNSRIRLAALSTTSLFTFVTASHTSYAQDIDLIDQDTIVVTGTKQGLTTQEAEVSVDIFDEKRLDEEAIFRLDDALSRVPGVTSTGGANITIRGIGRFGAAGQGVTSNVYLDGAPISSLALGSGLDTTWDIAQIEVLRGPQSTVQGRNALAGAVVLKVNDPTYEWETKLRTRYASFNTRQIAGVVSGPIIEDELAFRISADYQGSDGNVTNGATVDSKLNAGDNLTLRGKLLVEPKSIPDLRAEFTVDYNDYDNGGGILGGGIAAPTNFTEPEFFEFDFEDLVTFSVPFTNEGEILRVLTDIEYDLTEHLSLQFIGTYEDATRFIQNGNPENPLEFSGLVNDANNFNGTGDVDVETYSAEFRMYYDFDRWSGSIGGYYFNEDNASIGVNAVPLAAAFPIPINPANTVLSTTNENQTNTRNFAFYGQTRFDLNEKWTFDFSIRYDNERFSNPSLIFPPTIIPDSCVVDVPSQAFIDAVLPGSGLTIPVSCSSVVDLVLPNTFFDETLDAQFSAILPRGAITYNIDDDLSVFFVGQRGYRAGGAFTFVNLENLGAVEVRQFDPEFLTTYEVGFRSQSLDGDLTFNGNVFYSLYNGQQVRIPGPSGTDSDAQTLNVGSSRIYGAEFSGDYRVTDELSLNASLSLLRAEFVDFPFQNVPPGSSEFQNLEGNLFPQAPLLSFNVGANYQHSSGFFTNASVAYTGARESEILNLGEENFTEFKNEFSDELDGRPVENLTQRLEARVLATARIGYTEDRFSIYVYGTNLFNDQTPIFTNFANVVQNPPTELQAAGAQILSNGFQANPGANQTFGPPRIVGIGLDLSF
ncbi:MAG: TonB-dependent receptor [Pseudomonadota bacterium]